MTATEQVTHTIEEALAKFELVEGAGSLNENTACVMTAISWAAGEAWSDSPQCAHLNLTQLAIKANDADGTSPEQRADILRAGATGLMDTWWVPGEVVVAAQLRRKVEGEELPEESPVERCLRVLAFVSTWKVDKARPDLRSADLRRADLRSANLSSANLRSANLSSANLSSANLSSANLSSANLSSADLRYANLRYADLSYADLSYANLRYADLSSANLRSAKNIGAAFGLTSARGDAYTLLPAGWKVDESTGLIVTDAEAVQG